MMNPIHRLPFAALLTAVLLAPSSASAADPTKLECIDANQAAQDLRRAGKLRQAREKLVVCVAESCPGPVREDCAQRLDEVDKATASIVFEAKDGAGNDLSAVRVTVDGLTLAEKLEGAAIAIDPGPHRFVFEAAGLPKVEKSLIIREGDKARHEGVVLSAARASPTQGSQSAPAQASRGVPVLAIVAGGVGVAGLVLGAATAFAATSRHSTLAAECAGSVCPPSAASDLDSFHTMRTVSAIGYVVGALGILGGGALWLLAPSRPSDAGAALWLGPASAGVMGTF